MSAITDTGLTVYAAGLDSDSCVPIISAVEEIGCGLRQYATLDSMLDDASPSATGCVLVRCQSDESRTEAVITRLRMYFRSLPVLVFLESGSTDHAVELMQQGVFSVLVGRPEHRKLVSTISAALKFSRTSQAGADSARDAAIRLQEATEKEQEVLQLILAGRKNREIAAQLRITVRAVEDRRFRLMRKVGVDSVAELIVLAVTARQYQDSRATAVTVSASPTDARHCLKGIEIWIPSDSESVLRLEQACYRDAATFQETSLEMTFARGEGLPGRIWKQRCPVFLKELIRTDFVRHAAAGVVGMTTAVGFPVFCRGDVTAVVLILLDSRHKLTAAFESWHPNPVDRALRLAGGCFINCDPLRRLSEFVHLPTGEGLPGYAAEHGRPYISSRFSDDNRAVRGVALEAEQLVSCAALPLTDAGESPSDVFLLYNSESTPMFSLLQTWKQSRDGSRLLLAAEHVDGVPSLSSQTSAVPPAQDGHIVADAWKRKRPVVAQNGTADRSVLRSQHIAAPSIGVAVPTIANGETVGVTVLAN